MTRWLNNCLMWSLVEYHLEIIVKWHHEDDLLPDLRHLQEEASSLICFVSDDIKCSVQRLQERNGELYPSEIVVISSLLWLLSVSYLLFKSLFYSMSYFMWHQIGRSLMWGNGGILIEGRKSWSTTAESSPSCRWKVLILSATSNILFSCHLPEIYLIYNLQDASALHINETISNKTLDSAVLVYNRVPKSGSSTVRKMLSKLSKLNGFSTFMSGDYTRHFMTTSKELE